MPTDLKTAAELKALAAALSTSLDAGLNPRWSSLETPQALALLIRASAKNEALAALQLGSTVDALAGMTGQAWIPSFLALYELLLERGYRLDERRYEFGCDASVQAVSAATSPMPSLGPAFEQQFGPDTSSRTARCIVLRTQSLNFVIVLNEAYGRQSLHIRRFWDSLAEMQASGHYYSEQDYARRKDLTLEDALRLSHELAEKYADDIPGVHPPRRLSIATVLGSSLFAGDTDASGALRYGDGRDAGYVLSTNSDPEAPEAKDMLSDGFAHAEYVAANLASALCCLHEADS